MTLDEAIEHCVDVHASCANEEDAELHLQLTAWLNELKELRVTVEQLRNEHGAAVFAANKLRDIVADIRDAASDADDRATQALEEMLE
jgi:hypothetical protein